MTDMPSQTKDRPVPPPVLGELSPVESQASGFFGQCGSSRVLQRSLWEAESSKDTYELARQKARELGAKVAAALDGKHQAELDAALAAPPVHP